MVEAKDVSCHTSTHVLPELHDATSETIKTMFFGDLDHNSSPSQIGSSSGCDWF